MNTPTPTPRPALKATGMRRRHARCLETELASLTAERDQLRAALALGQQNCDDAYDDLRAERAALRARAERAEAELAKERARLKEMAAELAHCAGYIASVRTDRLITWHEELYALQTLEWAEGAFEIAEKANAVLEAHDAAIKEDAK